jgi:uncharacterized protein YcgI (DUF1989 family)
MGLYVSERARYDVVVVVVDCSVDASQTEIVIVDL